MKALTLWQPWASLVALGVKTIETRSWSTSYRGPLAIHAAARKPPRVWTQDDGYAPPAADIIAMGRHWESFEDRYQPFQFGYDWVGPLGAVVATCTLVDVVPITDPDLESQHEHQRHLIASPPESGLRICRPSTHSAHGWTLEHCEDQRPYGDFSPGRYAWILADITALAEPIPAKGRQGLWEWAAS